MKLCRFQPLELTLKRGRSIPRKFIPSRAPASSKTTPSGKSTATFGATRRRTGRKWPLHQIKFLPPSTPEQDRLRRPQLSRSRQRAWQRSAERTSDFPEAAFRRSSRRENRSFCQRFPSELTSKASSPSSSAADVSTCPAGDDVRPYIAGYTCLERRHRARPAKARRSSGPAPRASTRSARSARYLRRTSTLPQPPSKPSSTASGNSPARTAEMIFSV